MSKNDYDIQKLRQTLYRYLQTSFENDKGGRTQGDDAVFMRLFHIISEGTNKEAIQAAALLKDFLILLEKAGIL